MLLSSQGTVKLCDFGSATTISHCPDYSWSAQQRALVEEEVRWVARVASSVSCTAHRVAHGTAQGSLRVSPRCWACACGAPPGSAALDGGVSAGLQLHSAQGLREGYVHAQCRVVRLRHDGFLCRRLCTPLGATHLASPPRALGPSAPVERRGGSFLGVQDPSASLVGAECRARVCPAVADPLRAGLRVESGWSHSARGPILPVLPQSWLCRQFPQEPAALGFVLVCLPRAGGLPAPTCHTSRPVCLGLGFCPSSCY